MDNLIDLERRNWGLALIDRLLYPLALLATPSFLLALMVYFVVGAFAESLGSGVRSFASVLLPLMLLAFLVAFKKDELQRIGRIGSFASFTMTLAIGLGLMALLVVAPTRVPVHEIVLSGSFSVLMFSRVALEKERMMFYYFGMILGLLLYVVLFGFPKLG